MQAALAALYRAFQARALILFWALDHLLLAALTLGHCKPYEMISSALWSLEQDQKMMGQIFRPIVDAFLYPFTGAAHCKKSYEWQIHIYKGPI